MKLVSWNVNGIRAALKKGFEDSIVRIDADFVCLQETKAQNDQVAEALAEVNGFHLFSNSAIRKGYSGTAILSKKEPIDVSRGIGIEEHDQEGRVITLEFDKFYLLSVYVPNSGNALVRLDYRHRWDRDFLAFLVNLKSSKPVIACGDFNVAHQEIDIARPKANYNKTAGYTQVEIDGFSHLMNAGFIDTFRHLYPDRVAYSWWSYRANARTKNIGWRIDYFVVAASLEGSINDAWILPDIHGSDHCPVGLEVDE